eukprot:Selendium_serpulae@DN5298_c0_g1_i4.p1
MSDYDRPSSDKVARIYIGNLPNDTQKQDIEQLFEKYGRISNVAIKRTVSGAPFAFVEYEDSRDAEDTSKIAVFRIDDRKRHSRSPDRYGGGGGGGRSRSPDRYGGGYGGRGHGGGHGGGRDQHRSRSRDRGERRRYSSRSPPRGGRDGHYSVSRSRSRSRSGGGGDFRN